MTPDVFILVFAVQFSLEWFDFQNLGRQGGVQFSLDWCDFLEPGQGGVQFSIDWCDFSEPGQEGVQFSLEWCDFQNLGREDGIERVYCGHLFHFSCLDKYMKTPPFGGTCDVYVRGWGGGMCIKEDSCIFWKTCQPDSLMCVCLQPDSFMCMCVCFCLCRLFSYFPQETCSFGGTVSTSTSTQPIKRVTICTELAHAMQKQVSCCFQPSTLVCLELMKHFSYSLGWKRFGTVNRCPVVFSLKPWFAQSS